MITLFSTPKPFIGHVNVIQRNAIHSWQCLHPDTEIILVGDDAGAAEVCAQFGIRHIKEVEKNRHGTKYLAGIYDCVRDVARHDTLCHVNCDIVLASDFMNAAQAVLNKTPNFLMAGRRWDLDVRNELDFIEPQWAEKLQQRARAARRQRPEQWIDYFLFHKDLYYKKIPQFVVGRPGWDNWLLWYPLSIGVPVIDASRDVLAVHQNHDYAYHPGGEAGVWHGDEAQENYRLHQGKFATLGDASHVLKKGMLRRNHRAPIVRARRRASARLSGIWFQVLGATRSVRHRLGLRSKARKRADS
jgi:hypothetical protein